MERNEIKLREKLLPGDIQRHRNYEVLIRKHKRSKLFKRTIRFFLYSLILTFVVLILIFISWYVIQFKKKQNDRPEDVRTTMISRVVAWPCAHLANAAVDTDERNKQDRSKNGHATT